MDLDLEKLICENEEEIKVKILFINGSPNKNGNTAALAETLLEGKEYTMKRCAKLYGMEYAGMAMDKSETKELGKSV